MLISVRITNPPFRVHKGAFEVQVNSVNSSKNQSSKTRRKNKFKPGALSLTRSYYSNNYTAQS